MMASSVFFNSVSFSLLLLGWQAIASIILTLPSLAVIVYLYYYESYTLKIEVIMSALMIALQGAEFIFACIFICTLCRPVTYT